MKLDHAVIFGTVLAAVVWIEHGHRIDLATPAGAAFSHPSGAVCPDSENVPYSADCIVFMQGEAASEARPRAKTITSTPVVAAVRAPASTQSAGPSCPPHNENMPYSARCLQFLSGWYWHGASSGPGRN